MIALPLKVTLVLLAGWVVARLCSHGSAALRQLVWTATLSGVLVVTVAQPLLPGLPLRFAPLARLDRAFDSRALVTPIREEPVPAGRAGAEPVSAQAPPPVPVATGERLPARALLSRLWGLGFLGVLGWCLLGRLGLARLLRRARRFDDPAWQVELETQRAAARLSRPVRLFVSGQVGSPVTWAVRRPVIVLPPEAVDWSAERRRVVLAHELAHIVRGDGIANLIAWATCALYWFHPLAWLAARRMRAESERAADDFVLARGVPPVEYAGHLLEVARGSRFLRLQGATAIGMARPQTLEGRLLAVLDHTRNRLPPRNPTRRAAWALCAGFTLPLASLAPTLTAAPAREASPGPVAPSTRQARADSTLEQSFPARPGGTLVLDLETGAGVRIVGWDQPAVRIRGRLSGPNWRQTLVMMKPEGKGVHLVTRPTGTQREFSTSHSFEIQVPKAYDVRISSSGGDVTISGVEGTFTGSTGGGEVRIEKARGRASIKTGGGNVIVTESVLDGRVSTGGGQVVVDRVQGDFQGTSGSGPVIRVDDGKGDARVIKVEGDRIRVIDEKRAEGTIHIEKAGGEVHLEQAPEGARIRTGGGAIRVGRGAGLVTARTGGGDITIGPIAGSVEAGTGAGSVQVSLTDPNGSVRIGTGNGAAILELPAGFTGRFELETAYTRHHRRTTIESDWPLTRTETDQWDSSMGSPRKFVRATGRAGNGAGVIRVTIVNGDITIRRRP